MGEKRSFSKNVITLITGTAFAQILPILASPILTRLYTPEEFGELGLFIALLGVFSVIASFKYELAIALPKKEEDAVNIFALSILFAMSFSAVLMTAIVVVHNTMEIKFIDEHFATYVWLFPVAVLLLGIFQALSNWNIRNQDFKLIAATQYYRSSTIVTYQIGGGFLGGSSLILITAQVVGQLVAVLKMGYTSINKLKENKGFITKLNLKKMLIRYKRFPLFYSGSALLNTLSVQLPLFMLAFYFNPTIVGYYTLANRVLAAPISIVGNAIAQPYLQKAVEKSHDNKLEIFSLQIFKTLLSIGLVPIIVVAIISPELFMIIFGSEWVKAGIYVQLIATWLLFVFISSPLSHIFTILELQKESLFFNLVLFISRVAVLAIGGTIGNDLLTIAMFGITGAILWFIQITWLLKKTGTKIRTTIAVLIIESLIGLPFIFIISLFKIINSNSILLITLSFLIIITFFLIRFQKRLNEVKLSKYNK
ncbi:lipopolysaccharide biosynthesis protein [Planomicrobium okeanokoites]|uniref:Lipopolysaccharide biosynthesis protein n=1 Tax=Planomicrobium okeanokoites TaxID=244 RepID=A0ABV7KN16_PLAOK|nr:lipopolysaccharide biosynthesis protein [Planomicrobium okeanokoites]